MQKRNRSGMISELPISDLTLPPDRSQSIGILQMQGNKDESMQFCKSHSHNLEVRTQKPLQCYIAESVADVRDQTAQESGGVTIPGSIKSHVDVPLPDMAQW